MLQRSRATFIWCGSDPPTVIGDFNCWNEEQSLRFEESGNGSWHASVDLRPDAYIEYALTRRGERLLDPLNGRRRRDGIGHVNNYFWMPEGRPTPLAKVDPSVAKGSLAAPEVINSFLVTGGKRGVTLYAPPGRRPESLLVVLDGQDYLHRARLPTIVDNMIAKSIVRPIAMAFVENSPIARTVEYSCNDATVAFLVNEVVALARKQLDLPAPERCPDRYGILGPSMGGLMALHAALSRPSTFGWAISQSGAFQFDAGFGLSFLSTVIPYLPKRDVKIWMDVGLYEWLLAPNREVHQSLVNQGYAVTYREYSGGHNYTSWRNELPIALEAMAGS